MLFKQKFSIAMVMLFVILATIFAHSGHYVQVDSDGLSPASQHDCFLCQQGIDSPPKEISLAFVAPKIFSSVNTDIFSCHFGLPTYVLALLRAPPHTWS